MKFFYDGINILIIQIKKISKNTKEKDILSLLCLLCFSIFLLITIFPLSKNFFKTILFPIISNFSNSIDILINHKVVHFSPINLDTFFYFSLYQIKKVITILTITLVIAIILVLIKKFIIKKLSIIHSIEFYFIVFIIVISVFYFYHTLFSIPLVILLVYFIPLGSGKYFLMLQNIRYFSDIVITQFELYPLNISKFKILYKAILIFICCLFSSIGLRNMFNLSSILSFVIVFSFFMVLLLKNKNENKVYYILKKLILFIMFFLIIIWANIKIEINTIKFLSLISTFYFSIDRIFSISKEVMQLIKSKSVLYYYEHENIPKKILLEEIIEIKYINKEIDEVELVKQIILFQRLNLNDELLKLINIYKKSKYTKYLQLVESIEYFIFTKLDESGNKKSLKKKLKKIINLKNQKINPVKIFLEYAYILFELNEYFESIKYYEEYFEYLSKEELLRLYEIYKKVNKLDKAKEIKEHFIL
ncbi:hypothetical protein FNSP10_06560 [Fusobacterium nucleatum]|uniref:Uncharacterized protein n=2 Tax=Fusobacterium nucleatum subsp. polymorphum TaxID=76857 RepID=A0A1Z3CM47_FUSNP|nr:hypothetical protein CBG50_12685 [Fusobacterium polymorphum]BEO97265.1 hypothetical protein FNCP10_21200 [Fusobacterium nucleatum]BEP07282.1 hypothetical protein FNSP10_06560 [Fusobacterium nucleatum]